MVTEYPPPPGVYAYIEASNNQFWNGRSATLTTPDITATPNCKPRLTFYYNMYGHDIGSFSIRVRIYTVYMFVCFCLSVLYVCLSVCFCLSVQCPKHTLNHTVL